MSNYKVYLCLFMCFVLGTATQGNSPQETSNKDKNTKNGHKMTLYHGIDRSSKTDNTHNMEVSRMRSTDGLTMAKIVGEVLEDNVKATDLNQDSSLESEHLIQVTPPTPRKLKKVKSSKKQNHLKSKKSDATKNKKKRKLNNKKRKYPKKYNPKKHALKKQKKDKQHPKKNSKHEKKNKKVKSKASKKAKSSTV